jgi:hypothetical protein
MKGKKTNADLLTIRMMSDKTGLSKKSLHCAVRRLAIPRRRTAGINGYTFTTDQFKKICSDDYIFEKMHNYKLRDYSMPPVIITYHIYESKMNK